MHPCGPMEGDMNGHEVNLTRDMLIHPVPPNLEWIELEGTGTSERLIPYYGHFIIIAGWSGVYCFLIIQRDLILWPDWEESITRAYISHYVAYLSTTISRAS